MIETDPKILVNRIPEKNLNDLKFISKKIKNLNHQVYLIGGSVRDLILNKEPKEYDLTTSLEPLEVKKNFKRVVETGIKHGTLTILIDSNSYEITTFRKDIDYIDGRRPEAVEFGATLSEDLKRRDFTMNGIALDVLEFKLIDEHEGINDIEKKIIRTIGDPFKRFSEDGLRPVRGIRFQSTLNFTFDDFTYTAIEKTKSIIEKISKERFHDELIKILESNKPSIGIKELINLKIFELFSKSDYRYDFVKLENIDLLINIPISLRLSYLIFQILGLKESEGNEFFIRIRFSLKNQKESLFFNQIINFSYDIFSEPRRFLFYYVKFIGNRNDLILINSISSLLKIIYSNKNIKEYIDELEIILKNEEIPLSLKDLKLDGNLIEKNFPELAKNKYGFVLNHLLEKVLIEPKLNKIENLLIETKIFLT